MTDETFGGARSRVLILSQDVPWPSVGGSRIRCVQLLHSALKRSVSIDLIVVAPGSDIARDAWAVPTRIGLDTHLFNDESKTSVAQMPFRTSPGAKRLASEMCEDRGGYDAVHLEGHFLWPVVPKKLRSRTVVVEQNIESQLVRQRMALGHPLTAADVATVGETEQQVWRQAGTVIALTDQDAAEIRRRTPDVVPHVVPNGWDHLPARPAEAFDDRGRLTTPRLLFFGDYDYLPNRDALGWLLDEILPQVRLKIPAAELVLGGINMTSELREAARGCAGARAVGYIDDLGSELDRADIVLCPLRWGGGVKVKVTESLRRSSLLVSTTTSGMGIPGPLRSAICYADDVAGFVEHIVRLSGDSAERTWRRTQLATHQHLVPTWEQSSAQTMRLWAMVSNRADGRDLGRRPA